MAKLANNKIDLNWERNNFRVCFWESRMNRIQGKDFVYFLNLLSKIIKRFSNAAQLEHLLVITQICIKLSSERAKSEGTILFSSFEIQRCSLSNHL